jgi:hypothetical protein
VEQLQTDLVEKEEEIKQLSLEKSEAESQAATLKALNESQQQQIIKVM